MLAVTLIMAQVAHLAMTALSGGNRSLKLRQLHIIDLLIQLFGSKWVWTTFLMPWMRCVSYTHAPPLLAGLWTRQRSFSASYCANLEPLAAFTPRSCVTGGTKIPPISPLHLLLPDTLHKLSAVEI